MQHNYEKISKHLINTFYYDVILYLVLGSILSMYGLS